MCRINRCLLQIARRILCVFLLLVSLFSLMGCYGVVQETENNKVLRILVEKNEYGDSNGLEHQIDLAIQHFAKEYPDNQIVLEELPKPENGRAEMLQKLRTELMAGEGPDVLLFSGACSDLEVYNPREPLLADVELAMRNGLFYDISEFYDADGWLQKEELEPVIMEAGVLEEARYVLPLRFDIPVIYVEKNRFAETGLSEKLFEMGILEMIDYFTSMEDDAIVSNFFLQYVYPQFAMNMFPQLFDYENGTVAVTWEEIETFLRAYQAYRLRFVESVEQHDVSDKVKMEWYTQFGEYWTEETDNFLLIQSLQNLLEIMAIGKTKGAELEAYPLRSADGSVVADITFYGAVSAGSRNPKLAYEFIRLFLTEDYQWDRNAVSRIGNYWYLSTYGWPVRTKGSFGEVAQSAQEASKRKWVPLKYEIDFSVLTDEDMAVEELPIDSARFSIALEHRFWLDMKTLQDYHIKGPTDVDIPKLAEEWMQRLRIHIEEG